MNGKSQLRQGMGVHTIQYGYLQIQHYLGTLNHIYGSVQKFKKKENASKLNHEFIAAITIRGFE